MPSVLGYYNLLYVATDDLDINKIFVYDIKKGV